MSGANVGRHSVFLLQRGHIHIQRERERERERERRGLGELKASNSYVINNNIIYAHTRKTSEIVIA